VFLCCVCVRARVHVSLIAMERCVCLCRGLSVSPRNTQNPTEEDKHLALFDKPAPPFNCNTEAMHAAVFVAECHELQRAAAFFRFPRLRVHGRLQHYFPFQHGLFRPGDVALPYSRVNGALPCPGSKLALLQPAAHVPIRRYSHFTCTTSFLLMRTSSSK
jgi:hypothetical protein